MIFECKNVRLVNSDKQGKQIKKWYVSYTILYPNDNYPDYPVKINIKDKPLSLKSNRYSKFYGGEHSINLNDIKDPAGKLAKDNVLLRLIRENLANGIDLLLNYLVELKS